MAGGHSSPTFGWFLVSPVVACIRINAPVPIDHFLKKDGVKPGRRAFASLRQRAVGTELTKGTHNASRHNNGKYFACGPSENRKIFVKRAGGQSRTIIGQTQVDSREVLDSAVEGRVIDFEAVSDWINTKIKSRMAEGDGKPLDNLQLLGWSALSRAVARQTALLYVGRTFSQRMNVKQASYLEREDGDGSYGSSYVAPRMRHDKLGIEVSQ
ncbi:hypothetical protein K438DRAFT_1784599 [Mycena galopus ATCC 62051]|nr:hypothetical protein K438DRAFT_1784599 [Mycena galopus ATCC 62051]